MANEISKTPTQAKPQVIPLSKIHDLPNVFIAKPQDKSLGSMVLSIESSGIKEPVILRQRDDGEYQLLSGYRRRRASELAKKPDIPAHVYEMTMQEAIAYRKAVKNNPNAPMEFPEMYRHWDKIDQVLYQERGIHLTILRHPKGFEWLMFDQPKEKPKTLENRAKLGVPPYGNGWPGIRVRWCTGQLKTHLIAKEVNRLKKEKNALHYVGIAADEPARIKDEIYPLVEWGITEAQALKICYDRGFDWNGLYEIYHRCSCWCCPFQRIGELKNLRCYHPELWARLRELDKRALDQFGHSALGRFKDNWNVEQLEHRFAAEDAARKEAEMEQDKSKEIRDMLKGVPPKNVIIAVDDLPPKTLEQHLKERQKGQKKPQKRKKGR